MLEFSRLPELCPQLSCLPQRSSEKYPSLERIILNFQRVSISCCCTAPLYKWIFLCETPFFFFLKPRASRPPERMSKCKSALFFASNHSQAMSRCFTDDTQHPLCLELDDERNSLQDFLVTSLLNVVCCAWKVRGGISRGGVPGKSTSALNLPPTIVFLLKFLGDCKAVSVRILTAHACQ